MPHLEGNRTPEMRRPRLSLSGSRDPNTAQPAKNELANYISNADPVQQWGNDLWQARNAWDIAQHRAPRDADDWLSGGAWARRRLSKSDAAELLGLAFAAIDGAGQ